MNIIDIMTELSKNRINPNKIDSIEMYFRNDIEWETLIGQLMFHKIVCRAYLHMNENGWLKFIPPTIRRYLRLLFDVNKYKNELKQNYFINLVDCLNSSNVPYCILKGLPIEKDLFNDSIREYNDTDILVHIDNLTIIDNLLKELNYEKGIYNPKLHRIEFNRHRDIYNTMNTHQTLPYSKLLDDYFFRTDTIDLQFEFTLQNKFNYNINTEQMIERRICYNIYNMPCYTLNPFDNFLLLCTHLYGEAILIEEIEKYKDLQLSKFADIYEWVEKYYKLFNWKERISYIESHGFLKPVLFCVFVISSLYGSSYANDLNSKFGKQDLSFLDEYRDGHFNIKHWNDPIMKRIFKINKMNMV